MSLLSVNPATGETVAERPEMGDADLVRAVEAAGRASAPWAATPLATRVALAQAAARLLRVRAEDFARLAALEMGKPLPQGRAEAEKCAFAFDHFAENAERYLAAEAVDAGGRAVVVLRPMGTILAVMPWNFPFWQVCRVLAPALVAGNTALLKHAPNVQGCAEALVALVRDAGFPGGVLTNLPIDAARVEAVIRRPEVRAVTVTGSARAGRAVAAAAGAALKKCVLELGGSDPYVVLHDADLDLAARACVASRLVNAGQSCIAAKRFIVVEEVRAAFTDRVVDLMRGKSFGPPLESEAFDMGPLVRREAQQALHEQVARSVAAGAKLLCGGELPEGPGAYHPATVLAEVPREAPAWREETFGPVAAIVSVPGEDEAFAAASDSPFGLGGAVFTADVERGGRLAALRLEAGCVAVNDFVRSDPRLPFGGTKESGFGRELSAHGLREFMNVKAVILGS